MLECDETLDYYDLDRSSESSSLRKTEIEAGLTSRESLNETTEFKYSSLGQIRGDDHSESPNL